MTEENLNYPGAEEALRQFAVEGCLKDTALWKRTYQ